MFGILNLVRGRPVKISTLIRAINTSFYRWNPFLGEAQWHRFMGFIFLGIVSRLLPHPPNFTAFNAMALFSIACFGSLRLSLSIVFSTMFISDLIFGFHSSMVFVYSSLALIVLMGYFLNTKKSFIRTSFLLTLSSFLFFVVTNFGVWLAGSIYPSTALGLVLCYVAALPFFLNNLLGTLLYGGILYAVQVSSKQENIDLLVS